MLLLKVVMTIPVLGVQMRGAVTGRCPDDKLPRYRVLQIGRVLGDTLNVGRDRRAFGDGLIYVIDLSLHRVYAIDRVRVSLEASYRGVRISGYGNRLVSIGGQQRFGVNLIAVHVAVHR